MPNILICYIVMKFLLTIFADLIQHLIWLQYAKHFRKLLKEVSQTSSDYDALAQPEQHCR